MLRSSGGPSETVPGHGGAINELLRSVRKVGGLPDRRRGEATRREELLQEVPWGVIGAPTPLKSRFDIFPSTLENGSGIKVRSLSPGPQEVMQRPAPSPPPSPLSHLLSIASAEPHTPVVAGRGA